MPVSVRPTARDKVGRVDGGKDKILMRGPLETGVVFWFSYRFSSCTEEASPWIQAEIEEVERFVRCLECLFFPEYLARRSAPQ